MNTHPYKTICSGCGLEVEESLHQTKDDATKKNERVGTVAARNKGQWGHILLSVALLAVNVLMVTMYKKYVSESPYKKIINFFESTLN